MDETLKNKIIEEYLKGKGSTTIEKELKISKPSILKILNDNNLIRKKERCKTLNIQQDGDVYYLYRICPNCDESTKVSSNHPTITCRNFFNTKNLNCRKCLHQSQIGIGNPFYGKTHSDISKDKISKSRTGKYSGDENHMKKDIYREMSKNIMKNNWDNNILNSEKMSEQLKNTRRNGKIKSVISSKKEKEIITLINKLGFDSVHSYRVDSKICDIYIPTLNLIIEYFGDYWHCNPIKYSENYFNQKKNMLAKEIWEYDSKKIDLIKKYGYNLEVIWETEYKNDNKLINKIIEKYVKSI